MKKLNMKRFYENKETRNARYETIREWKREREEGRRWKRFEMERETFDARIEEELDAYEAMMRNL
jgi:hypothetical protein